MDEKHKSYGMLHISWSLVLSEHKELGLGVDLDIHDVLGTGDQGALGVQALLTVASITLSQIFIMNFLDISSYHRRICRLLFCMKPRLHIWGFGGSHRSFHHKLLILYQNLIK